MDRYEEALERANEAVKRGMVSQNFVDDIFGVESEDERIRKDIINLIEFALKDGSAVSPGSRTTKEEALAYLEKQKEFAEREYVLRPLPGTTITSAAKQAIRRAKEGDHIVLAFNDIYMPVSKHDSTQRSVESYFEKQKEQKHTDIPSSGSGAMGTTPPAYKLDVKPAEWSEEDERIRQCLIRSCEKELDDLRNDKYGHQEIVSDLKECYRERINWLKSLRPQPSPQLSTNHTVWHNASEEKPTKLPIIHIWYHGNRVNAVTHEDTCLQAELDDINFQPDDKWAYVEDLLNVQPHWKPSEQ